MHEPLALNGGTPVRATLLPYGRQSIDATDVEAVTCALKSDFLTTGSEVSAFEKEFAAMLGVPHAVAVCNGTAALHCAMHAVGIGQGDEVIVPTMTMAATANAVLMQGGRPVLCDVAPDTLLIDCADAEKKITKKTKAIIAVDFAGQPCDYDTLRALTQKHGITLVADVCHALGATYRGQSTGTLADISVFSFHPVKAMTTGEGGMIVTSNVAWADAMRKFRHHCISIDPEERKRRGSWHYSIDELGYNYRLTDIQCALGRSQLKRLPQWTKQRQHIAARFDEAFENLRGVCPLQTLSGNTNGYHLYIVRWMKDAFSADRDTIFKALYAEGIGVNLHYTPVHLLGLYRKRCGTEPGQCPHAEATFAEMLTLPLFTTMTDRDVDDVIAAVHKVHAHFAV